MTPVHRRHSTVSIVIPGLSNAVVTAADHTTS